MSEPSLRIGGSDYLEGPLERCVEPAAAFLPDASFILAPKLNTFIGCAAAIARSVAGSFFKDAIASAACWGWFGRPLNHACSSRWSRSHTPVILRYSTP
jgi:hypothetical protein